MRIFNKINSLKKYEEKMDGWEVPGIGEFEYDRATSDHQSLSDGSNALKDRGFQNRLLSE